MDKYMNEWYIQYCRSIPDWKHLNANTASKIVSNFLIFQGHWEVLRPNQRVPVRARNKQQSKTRDDPNKAKWCDCGKAIQKAASFSASYQQCLQLTQSESPKRSQLPEAWWGISNLDASFQEPVHLKLLLHHTSPIYSLSLLPKKSSKRLQALNIFPKALAIIHRISL